MIDIRDHGGSFSGGSEKLPYKSYTAVRLAYDAGVCQVDKNGDVYGYTRGRYTANRSYYHATKNGTTVKTKNESQSGQYKGYFKDFYTTVTNNTTLNLYNHLDQLIESFIIPTGETISEGGKFNGVWVIYTGNNVLKTFKPDGTLIASASLNDTSNMLSLNFSGLPYLSGSYSTTSGGYQALYTSCAVVTKNGSIVSLGSYNLNTDSTYSMSAAKAVLMIQRMVYFYNE